MFMENGPHLALVFSFNYCLTASTRLIFYSHYTLTLISRSDDRCTVTEVVI